MTPPLLGLCFCGRARLNGADPAGPAADTDARPNFIVIFCDDLGYGDVGCFGSKKIRTPNVDRMAAEGMCFTSFSSTCGVCSPSRASLMTGCYPRRVNLHQSHDTRPGHQCVLYPADRTGLHPDEITVAEVLKQAGYATMCIGKWHLGDQREFLPTRQGFDSYFGIPYSNDMGRKNIPLPLLRGEVVIEAPVSQETLTRRYTEKAVRFIEKNKERPFFLYLPHTFPHFPLFASERFRGKSQAGEYGDAVEEIDWSVGEILDALKRLGIDSRTLVVFTSDNGGQHPWGSNAPLRGTKGSTLEGGMRVPCVIRWPGRIPPGRRCDQVTATIDLLPTFARLARANPPSDRVIDGKDIWPLMAGREDARSPHEAFYYYGADPNRGAQMDQLQAVRAGKWKLHLAMKRLKLFDLEADVHEDHDLAAQHPEVVTRLQTLADRARQDLGDVGRCGQGQRPAGWVDKAAPLLLERP